MELGSPCWNSDGVAKAIGTTVAAVDRESVPYFLSAHSPFKYVADLRNPRSQIGEEEVFREIFSPSRSEVLAVIKGEPGTGKSHLVHWLKLRTDFASDSGEAGFANVTRVLVQRENGSLKDALRQIIEQLGPSFQRELQKVNNAIERLSVGTARATLLSELVLELEHRWGDRGRIPIPSKFRHLGLLLRSQGTQRWFLRDEGVIAQTISRLTENTAEEHRETFPAFTEEELSIPAQYRSPNENVRDVINLLDNFSVEPEQIPEAAKILNEALLEAKRELTGLRGSNLQSVFQEIRKKLGPSRVLALFIEDVSVTGFDRDVINALEPQHRDGLCKMVAVIGITSNGWNLLETAQKQRVAPAFEIGAEMTKRWIDDPVAVGEFTARYLNSVRLKPSQVERLAKARFGQKDLTISACEGCPVKEECHQTFGHQRIGEVDVGFFPFNAKAPRALLSRLRVAADGSGVMRTQRGLLNSIVRPILDAALSDLRDSKFPAPRMVPVEQVAIPVWDRFRTDYLGGANWDERSRARLEFLAIFWIEARDVPTLAALLKPFLKPLKFPAFTRQIAPPPIKPPPLGPVPPPPPPGPIDTALEKELTLLKSWIGGGPLNRDSEFRNLIGRVISSSIAWEDQRTVPITIFNDRVKGSGFPRFEGQPSRVANQPFFFEIERSDSSFGVMNALVRFAHAPNGSWSYEGGQRDQRTVVRWVRKNREKIIGVAAFAPPEAKQRAIAAAAGILLVASSLRDRQIPASQEDKINALMSPAWDEEHRPTTLGRELREIVHDVERRAPSLQRLLVETLGLGQGRAEPSGFINPVPLLEAISDFERNGAIQALPAEALSGAQKTYFDPIKSVGPLADLKRRVDDERKAIDASISEIARSFDGFGVPISNPTEDLPKALAQLVSTFEVQQGAVGKEPALPCPDPDFDRLWADGRLGKNAKQWGAVMKGATDAVGSKTALAVLTFDPAALKEFQEITTIVNEHLDTVVKHLTQIEADLRKRGGDKRAELLASLDALSAMAPKT